MSAGRPAIKKPTAFGQRLGAARKESGLTQQELADQIGVTQRVVAYWERESVGLKADQLISLADALGISVDLLLGREAKPKQRGGSQGRAKRILDQITSLPRGQQRKVLDTVETLIAGQVAQGNSSS